MKKGSKLLKISEAAELLNTHNNTLRQWDKKGIIKAVRFGQRGIRYYRKEDVMKLIQK